jgi:methylenetetrahydrofolate reductase (NADPH)
MRTSHSIGARSSWALPSLELSPTGLLRAGSATAKLLAMIPTGTCVYLPALPADPPDAVEGALRLLRRENAGLLAVPHIPATRVASTAALERQLGAWQRASGDGVREVLIVRGDLNAHHGEESATAGAPSRGLFGRSLDLLETGVLQRAGIHAVSLCGHPEGVGHLSAAGACEALVAKLQWAEAASVEARIVTQFCFSARATIAYAEQLRAAGVTAPLSVGVVGPCKAEIRTRMAERCGVTPPAGGESDHPDGALLNEHDWPSEYVRALAQWQRDGLAGASGHGVQALHLYPFGGLGSTLRWVEERLPGLMLPAQ